MKHNVLFKLYEKSIYLITDSNSIFLILFYSLHDNIVRGAAKKLSVTNGQTDRRTDRQTDGQRGL